ncbi:MAG: DUF5674 family protein [Patescibacteria group bacterium]
MEIILIKEPVTREELTRIAQAGFGNFVKAVVDISQGVMAIGGELHADEETVLTEQCQSKREHTWGINLYQEKKEDEWIEFDSMINLKPQHGNRSRSVENPEIREAIVAIVNKLIEN